MSNSNKKTVYLMPGMGASPKIFEKINLGEDFNTVLLDWKEPFPDETLSDYARRIAKDITHKNPILLGVSFGGIIVQEISKIIDYEGIIIISSVKKNSELPLRMKISKYTYLHKLLPVQIVGNRENWKYLPNHKTIQSRLKLYGKYMGLSSSNYLKWSIDRIVNWEQETVPERLIHIQGTKDIVFPIKNIKNAITVKIQVRIDFAKSIEKGCGEANDWCRSQLGRQWERGNMLSKLFCVAFLGS